MYGGLSGLVNRVQAQASQHGAAIPARVLHLSLLIDSFHQEHSPFHQTVAFSSSSTSDNDHRAKKRTRDESSQSDDISNTNLSLPPIAKLHEIFDVMRPEYELLLQTAQTIRLDLVLRKSSQLEDCIVELSRAGDAVCLYTVFRRRF